jgi:hypothetical protein
MKKILFLYIIPILLFPLFVFADHTPINLNLVYPKFGPFDITENQHLPEIVGFIYYFIVTVAGLAAFVMLVWGGIQWLTSGAIPSQASAARDRIRSAILGLLLILASVLIIQIINPELTVLSLDPITGGEGEAPIWTGELEDELPPPMGGPGDNTITVDLAVSISVPHPVPSPSPHTLNWSTTLPGPVCTGVTNSTPFNADVIGLWNFPVPGSIDPSGSASIDLSTIAIADDTRIDFVFTCENAVESSDDIATIQVGGAGGTPPTITQFEVRDANDDPGTWLPGGPEGSPPTYSCCGSFPDPSDFPLSSDLEFRWDSVDATECWGSDDLGGIILGAPSGTASIGTGAWGLYTYTLRCIGTALPDARMQILVDKTQP